MAHIDAWFPPLTCAAWVGGVISGVATESETEDNEAPEDDEEVILSRLRLSVDGWGEDSEEERPGL